MTNEQILAQPEPRCPLCEFQYFSRSKYTPRTAYIEFAEHLMVKHNFSVVWDWQLFSDSGRDERIIEAYMLSIFK